MNGYKPIKVYDNGKGAIGYYLPLKQTLRKEKIKRLFRTHL
jgi:hypothetical protein